MTFALVNLSKQTKKIQMKTFVFSESVEIKIKHETTSDFFLNFRQGTRKVLKEWKHVKIAR